MSDDIKKRHQHLLEYWLLKGFFNFMSLLPERAAYGSARVLGLIWYAVDGRRRRVATENISQAGDYPWRSRARELTRANFLHLAENVVEFSRMRDFTKEELSNKVEFAGEEILEGAHSKGKGVLLLTGHIGNWEMTGSALSARGWPLSVVARSMKNPMVDKLITKMRSGAGLEVIGHRRATGKIMRALSKGKIVAVLLDHSAQHKEAVFVDFFGRLASTNYGLALLAMKTGSPVVPAFSIRVRPHNHLVRFMPEIELDKTGNKDRDVLEATKIFAKTLEGIIAEHPEQWLWIHRRWKRQPEGKPC